MILRLGNLIQYSSEVPGQIERFQEEGGRLECNKSLSEQEKELLLDKCSSSRSTRSQHARVQ